MPYVFLFGLVCIWTLNKLYISHTKRLRVCIRHWPASLWVPCCLDTVFVRHIEKSSSDSAHTPWQYLSIKSSSQSTPWSAVTEIRVWLVVMNWRVWLVGLLLDQLPWYCIPGLSQASCRNFNRNGFMTSEQRWKAVRMYNNLQPLWQLSLHRNIPRLRPNSWSTP